MNGEPRISRRGGPPRAGVVAAVGAVLLGVILFVAGRSPAPTENAGTEPTETAAAVSTAADGATANPAPPARPGPAGEPDAPAPVRPPAAPREPTPPPDAAPAVKEAPVSNPNPNELPPDHPPISVDEKTQVGIQWLGQSCFYIHSPGSVTVVTDPFDPKATGLAEPAIGAHLVTISAETPEHNHAAAVHAFEGEAKQVIRGTETRRGDVRIHPVPTYRDRANRERNVAYVIEAGALRIAHLGDIGHTLNPEQLRRLGPIDILMLPVGGDGLSPKDAVAVAQQVRPKVVLPMEYSTIEMTGPAAKLRPVEEFIAASPYAVTRKDSDVMMISKGELPPSTEIYVLQYRH